MRWTAGCVTILVLAACAQSGPALEAVLPSVGDLPRDRAGRPEVELLTCDLVEDDGGGSGAGSDSVEVRAAVTNQGSGPQILQGVPVEVTLDGRAASSEDEELWNSATIGPGRQMLVEETVDLDVFADPGDPVACELGEPDLRPVDGAVGRDLDRSDLELEGCEDGDQLRVHNPTDEPIGVVVLVELFDQGGYSLGTLELGQFPRTYTDGTEPAADEVALPGGEWGEYPIEIDTLIGDRDTPHESPVTSCQVVEAAYQVDPEPIEVIID